MSAELGLTIAGFAITVLLQTAGFGYLYGRLTKDVELNRSDIDKKADKGQVQNVETTVTKLSSLFEKFLSDVDAKLDRVREADKHEDVKVLNAVTHLETYMESAVNWIGERMGHVGSTLSEHDRLIRKALKASNLSDDRIPAQSGVTGSGQHAAMAPPPRPRKDPRID